MNTQHTPGPWTFDRDTLGIEAENGFVVARVPFATSRGKEFVEEMAGCRANGRLLAAAPELLAALQMAVLQNDHDMLMTGEELRQCAVAIAKATGGQA